MYAMCKVMCMHVHVHHVQVISFHRMLPAHTHRASAAMAWYDCLTETEAGGQIAVPTS